MFNFSEGLATAFESVQDFLIFETDFCWFKSKICNRIHIDNKINNINFLHNLNYFWFKNLLIFLSNFLSLGLIHFC
jgi:hypothetical protein